MVALTCNFSIGIVETGGLGIHGLSQLYCEFVANVGYNPISKNKNTFLKYLNKYAKIYIWLLYMLGKCCTSKLCPQPLLILFNNSFVCVLGEVTYVRIWASARAGHRISRAGVTGGCETGSLTRTWNSPIRPGQQAPGILQSLLPQQWDYKCAPSCLAFYMGTLNRGANDLNC